MEKLRVSIQITGDASLDRSAGPAIAVESEARMLKKTLEMAGLENITVDFVYPVDGKDELIRY